MERVILYVDDLSYALEQVRGLRSQGLKPSHWLLVACPPRVTSRISKWVSHSARESWRAKWLLRLEQALAPLLASDGARVMTVLAQGPLLALTQELLLTHGAARVIDIRRPKVGAPLEPVQPSAEAPRVSARPQRPPPTTGHALGFGMVAVLGALLE